MRDVYVTIWGSRGSGIMSGGEFQEYGSNTSCASVSVGDRVIVFDAGSGLAELGKQLSGSGFHGRIDLFLSHVHLDHINGLFRCSLLYHPEVEFHIYAGLRENGIRETLHNIVGSPYWPVRLEEFGAKLYFHDILPGERIVLEEGCELTSMVSSHPNGCLLYRLDAEGKSVLYGLDCEMDRRIWESLVEFAAGCDLLICDAFFAPEETESKKGWGHSSWRQGNRLLRECGGRMVIHAHHGWEADDAMLHSREAVCMAEEPGSTFARDGMTVRL